MKGRERKRARRKMQTESDLILRGGVGVNHAIFLDSLCQQPACMNKFKCIHHWGSGEIKDINKSAETDE